MKQSILFVLLLVAIPFALRAQSMRITPDSGYQGQSVSVTIVGNGTQFSSSNNASSVQVQVMLERLGVPVVSANYAELWNSTTINASIPVGATMLGSYDLVVKVTDTAERTFTLDSAFRVTLAPPIPPKIVSVNPSSAYDSQTVNVTITGQNTTFPTGSYPTISFLLNGTTYFTAQVDSIYSNTSIKATVTVPVSSAPAGVYNVIVRNGTYSDTGKQLFTVLGHAPIVEHLPMRMTPDSGYQKQQLSVTIVGSGTHFGATNNASMSQVEVMLEQSGTIFDEANYVSVVNDSTLQISLEVSSEMLVGNYYDLYVVANDTSQRTYIQDSAFHVIALPTAIVSVNPSSAYDSQTVAITITGQSTTFASGPSPTISFLLNGTPSFTAQLDSIYSNTSLGATLTVPVGTAPGVYDVIVHNGTYSDTGKRKFTVLGPIPSAMLVPDSGANSTAFDVSIVGQNTDFAPSINASFPITMDIDLKQGGVSFYHTTADTVFSTVLAGAVFNFSDTLAPGMYDAEISGNTNGGGSYDLHTPFLVTSGTAIRIPFGYGIAAKPADTVTLHLTGSKVNFIYQGTQYVKTVKLVNGAYSITATNVTVENDTSLSAFFTIPAGAAIGKYDIQVVEPGTGITIIGSNEFTVGNLSSVSPPTDPNSWLINSLLVSPNPAQDVASISFSMSAPSHVRLTLFDALGRTVATLCDRTISGAQSFEWSAANMPSGSYFYELMAGDEIYGGRVVLQH